MMFVARQTRPGPYGFKVLRTYLVRATDPQRAEQLAREAFPRPMAEFAAEWQVRRIPDPAEGEIVSPDPRDGMRYQPVIEIDTEEWCAFFDTELGDAT